MNTNQLLPATVGVRAYPDGRLDPVSAAVYLGLSPKTLAQMRTKGTGPEFVRVGGKKIFYRKEALDAFIENGRGVAAPQNRARRAGGAK